LRETSIAVATHATITNSVDDGAVVANAYIYQLALIYLTSEALKD
jgi:hypothetical protein